MRSININQDRKNASANQTQGC